MRTQPLGARVGPPGDVPVEFWENFDGRQVNGERSWRET